MLHYLSCLLLVLLDGLLCEDSMLLYHWQETIFCFVAWMNDFDEEFWLNGNYTITYVGRQCTGIRFEALVIGYEYRIKCVIRWALSCSG
jgi:hypothetical protein